MYEVLLGSKGVMQIGWCTLKCRFSTEVRNVCLLLILLINICITYSVCVIVMTCLVSDLQKTFEFSYIDVDDLTGAFCLRLCLA